MKTILVTGGSRGIGAATALLAAKHGYSVVVNYNANKSAAEKIVQQITNSGGNAIAIKCDISDEVQMLKMFEKIDNEFGEIHSLVNNAGILEQQQKIERIDILRLRRIFEINVFAQILCAREAIRRMSTKHGGSGGTIVNVSSIAARTGSPGEYVDYAASKGAIDTFTIGLAKEVAGEGIRVNGVRPAFIHTDIHAAGGEPGRIERIKESIPLKRGGSAKEVASAIMWLAGDESGYTTGSFIEVTGGVF